MAYHFHREVVLRVKPEGLGKGLCPVAETWSFVRIGGYSNRMEMDFGLWFTHNLTKMASGTKRGTIKELPQCIQSAVT